MHGNVRVFTSDQTLPWPRQIHVVEAGDGAFTAPPQQILLQIIHLAPSAVLSLELQLLKPT